MDAVEIGSLPLRAMVVAAVRSARRVQRDYRLPVGHGNARKAPKGIASALAVAEQFCTREDTRDERFVRRAALVHAAASIAEGDAQILPRQFAEFPQLAPSDQAIARRMHGDLGSMTIPEYQAAYNAAHAAVCTVQAVCLVTLSWYEPRGADGDSYLLRVPRWIVEAINSGQRSDSDLAQLASLSTGETF